MKISKQKAEIVNQASSTPNMNRQKASKKYRRIKTVVKKVAETSSLCNVQMVLYIWEPAKRKLKEIYTHSQFRNQELQDEITRLKQNMPVSGQINSLNAQAKQKSNTFQSFDAKKMYSLGEKDEPEQGEIENQSEIENPLPPIDSNCSQKIQNEDSQPSKR